jgi:hypothetical protein
MATVEKTPLAKGRLSDMQIAYPSQSGVNEKMRCAAHGVSGNLLPEIARIPISLTLLLVRLLSQSLYVREEAGTQRYNVGTDTPKLFATSCGGVPLANSFLAA